ncbi:hypothetical protein FRC09_014258 [Ceratobasidium sp. 395]|nr:hypothetical protein FRC09_014258 [Ceratobasidium sp. 395]
MGGKARQENAAAAKAGLAARRRPREPDVAEQSVKSQPEDANTTQSERHQTPQERSDMDEQTGSEMIGGAINIEGMITLPAGSVTTIVPSYQDAKVPQDLAADALERLHYTLSIKAHCGRTQAAKLDSTPSIRRSTAMAAIGWGYVIRFGKNICRFIWVFIGTDDLPEDQYGTWNASVLEDKDLATKLKEYLVECKGRCMRAEDIVEYLKRLDS